MEARRNDLCHVCGLHAVAFALDGGSKVMTCEGHLQQMVAKGSTMYDIKAVSFIDSSQDVPAYEFRKAEITRILSFLQHLQSILNTEVQDAYAQIDSAKEKMIAVVSAAYEEAKWKIREREQVVALGVNEIENALGKYVEKKEHKLCKEYTWMVNAGTPTFTSVLNISVYDPRKELIQLIYSAVEVEHSSLNDFLRILDPAERTTRLRAVATAVPQTHTVRNIQMNMQRCKTVLEFEPNADARKFMDWLTTALKAAIKTENEEIVTLLKHVCDLDELKEVGRSLLDLGKRDSWFGDYPQAKLSIEKALDLFTLRIPLSKERINAALQLGRIHAVGQQNYNEAEKWFQEALEICKEQFPVSTAFVECCASLGSVYAERKQLGKCEEILKEGTSLAKEKFPQSLALAKIYRTWALFHRQSSDLENSLAMNQLALSLCLEIAPSSFDTVLSCVHAGIDLWKLNKFPEAEQTFSKGGAIYPHCAYSVGCFVYLSQMMFARGRKEEGEKASWRAVCIGVATCPKSVFTEMATKLYAGGSVETTPQKK